MRVGPVMKALAFSFLNMPKVEEPGFGRMVRLHPSIVRSVLLHIEKISVQTPRDVLWKNKSLHAAQLYGNLPYPPCVVEAFVPHNSSHFQWLFFHFRDACIVVPSLPWLVEKVDINDILEVFTHINVTVDLNSHLDLR